MFPISGSNFQYGAWIGPRAEQVGLHLFPSLLAHPGIHLMATIILMVVLNPDHHCNTDDDHQFGHGLVTTVVTITFPI